MNLFQRINFILTGKQPDDSALFRLHPELASRVPLFSLTSDEQPPAELAGYRQAAADYAAHVWTQKAVRIIGDSLAPLPVRVVDRGERALLTHPISLLLTSVNDAMT